MDIQELMEFGCTDNLAQVMLNIKNTSGIGVCLKYVEKISKDVKKYINTLKPYLLQNPKATMIIINELIDKSIKEDKVRYEANIKCDKCNKGDCCYINVDITFPEAQLISQWIGTISSLPLFLGEEAWKRLNIQADLLEKLPTSLSTADEFIKLPLEHRKCIFLKNERCSIYEVRPVKCRSYFINKNGNCDKETPENITSMWCSIESEKIITALLTFNKSYHLSNVLKDIYNLNVAKYS